MALSAKVVHLGGLHLGDDVNQVGAVAQITVMEMELVGT